MTEENEKRPGYHWPMFVTLASVLVALNIALTFHLSERARVERNATGLHEEQVRRGAALFVANCAVCHGDDGQGTEKAPGLNDKGLLSAVSDDFLRHTIADGRPRAAMPAWGQDEGGPLTAQEIDQLVAFIRNWEKPAVEIGRTLTASGLPAESAAGGQETFIWFCAGCHGDDGTIPTGTQDIILNSPQRLRQKTEADVRLQIMEGGDEMPGLANLLSPAEVDGLIEFMNTWPR
ncbi:MAG: c-type cytochrome [Anaerolineae bacterium]